jgi:hypothetical protein
MWVIKCKIPSKVFAKILQEQRILEIAIWVKPIYEIYFYKVREIWKSAWDKEYHLTFGVTSRNSFQDHSIQSNFLEKSFEKQLERLCLGIIVWHFILLLRA